MRGTNETEADTPPNGDSFDDRGETNITSSSGFWPALPGFRVGRALGQWSARMNDRDRFGAEAGGGDRLVPFDGAVRGSRASIGGRPAHRRLRRARWLRRIVARVGADDHRRRCQFRAHRQFVRCHAGGQFPGRHRHAGDRSDVRDGLGLPDRRGYARVLLPVAEHAEFRRQYVDDHMERRRRSRLARRARDRARDRSGRARRAVAVGTGRDDDGGDQYLGGAGHGGVVPHGRSRCRGLGGQPTRWPCCGRARVPRSGSPTARCRRSIAASTPIAGRCATNNAGDGIGGLLNDASLTTLSNGGAPGGPFDFTGGMQWTDRAIQPGASFSVSVTFAVNATVIEPELVVIKSNDVDGVVGVDDLFAWTLLLINASNSPTVTFAPGQVLLRDQLPSTGLVYDSTVVTNIGGTTGTVDCLVAVADLVCTATTAVSIPRRRQRAGRAAGRADAGRHLHQSARRRIVRDRSRRAHRRRNRNQQRLRRYGDRARGVGLRGWVRAALTPPRPGRRLPG